MTKNEEADKTGALINLGLVGLNESCCEQAHSHFNSNLLKSQANECKFRGENYSLPFNRRRFVAHDKECCQNCRMSFILSWTLPVLLCSCAQSTTVFALPGSEPSISVPVYPSLVHFLSLRALTSGLIQWTKPPL